MNKFYTTMSPDTARHILLKTEQEAVEEAKNKVAEDGRVRYVCMILFKVEPENPPVKVSKVY
jgi:hypothetical protein